MKTYVTCEKRCLVYWCIIAIINSALPVMT